MRTLTIAILAGFVSTAFAQNLVGRQPDLKIPASHGGIEVLCFSPDGKTLVTSGAEGDLRLWDWAQASVTRTLFPKERRLDGANTLTARSRLLHAVAFSPDGSLLAEIGEDRPQFGSVRIWNAVDGGEAALVDAAINNPRALDFSPDGKLIAYNASVKDKAEDRIILYDVTAKKIAHELRDDRLSAAVLRFSPDGKILSSAGATKAMFWDLETRKIKHVTTPHAKSVTDIAFRPDSTAMVTASLDDKVKIWGAADGKMIREFAAQQEGVLSIAWSPTGKVIATAGGDKTIKLWNPETGARMATMVGHLGKVSQVAFSHDGRKLVSGDRVGMVHVWSIDDASLKDLKDEKKDKKPGEKGKG